MQKHINYAKRGIAMLAALIFCVSGPLLLASQKASAASDTEKNLIQIVKDIVYGERALTANDLLSLGLLLDIDDTTDGGFVAAGPIITASDEEERVVGINEVGSSLVKYDKNGDLLWEAKWGNIALKNYSYADDVETIIFSINGGEDITVTVGYDSDVDDVAMTCEQSGIAIECPLEDTVVGMLYSVEQTNDGGYIALGINTGLMELAKHGIESFLYDGAIKMVKFDQNGQEEWEAPIVDDYDEYYDEIYGHFQGNVADENFYMYRITCFPLNIIQLKDGSFVTSNILLSEYEINSYNEEYDYYDYEDYTNVGMRYNKYDKNGVLKSALYKDSISSNGDIKLAISLGLIATNDGGFATAGFRLDNTDAKLLSGNAAKYSANMNEEWEYISDSRRFTAFFDIEELANGGYGLAGFASKLLPVRSYMVKLNADGSEAWGKTWLDDSTEPISAIATNVTELPNGELATIGMSINDINLEAFIGAKNDKDGDSVIDELLGGLLTGDSTLDDLINIDAYILETDKDGNKLASQVQDNIGYNMTHMANNRLVVLSLDTDGSLELPIRINSHATIVSFAPNPDYNPSGDDEFDIEVPNTGAISSVDMVFVMILLVAVPFGIGITTRVRNHAAALRFKK